MSVYTGERVRRGLWHFLLGKGVSSVAGLAAMVLVVRGLSIGEFAAYSVLVALVEVVTALTGLGLSHVILRYVPELYAARETRALGGLVGRAFLVRMAVLGLVVALALSDAPGFALMTGVGDWVAAFRLFMGLLIVRIAGHFLSQFLESTLHQSIAQMAFSLGAMVRVLVLTALMIEQRLSLEAVIWSEIAGDAVSLLVLLGGSLRVLHKGRGFFTSSWALENWRKLGHFAMSGYLQHLAILPYGGHMNRLVGGHVLATGVMATYGFAQSLYEYAKRYLPAQLLVGLIRPVVIARFTETRDFALVAQLCQHVLQINILLIAAMLVPLMISGPSLLLAISAHKYGLAAAWILLALFLVLVLETQRQQLELLAQTVERYDLLLPTNVLLSSSVLLAVLTVSALGPVAFPLANALGLIFANARVQRSLRRLGYEFRHDWLSTLATLLILLVSVLGGELLQWITGSWVAGALFGLASFVALALLLRRADLLGFYRELTKGALSGLPPMPPTNEPAHQSAPRIAFGVLSYRPEAAATVTEIARLVHPHPVYVHHDFSKGHPFETDASNVRVLSRPVQTGWGNWSLVAATYALMEEALKDGEVTHFQLLSEACLPIRAPAEFVAHLGDQRPAAMVDLIRMDDAERFCSHGWRYVPGGLLIRKVARKLSIWAWGDGAGHRQVAGVNLRLVGEGQRGWRRLRQRMSQQLLRVLAWWTRERVRRFGLSHLAIGGQWFGVDRRCATWLLMCRNQCPDLVAYFMRSQIPDEAFFQTLLSNAAEREPGLALHPGNHAMSWAGNGTGPDVLGSDSLTLVKATQRFFARKFTMNPEDPVRRRIVDQHLDE